MKGKSIITLGLVFVTLWDTITTIYGTYTILGDNVIQLFISIIFSILLTTYLLYTLPIVKNPSQELIPTGAKILWFLAFSYDLYTAFKGNYNLVLGNTGDNEKIIIAIGISIFTCSAPIGLSKIIHE